VTLHELTYLIHPFGRNLENGDPNKMRKFYNLKTGNPHDAEIYRLSPKWVENDEYIRLKNLRNRRK